MIINRYCLQKKNIEKKRKFVYKKKKMKTKKKHARTSFIYIRAQKNIRNRMQLVIKKFTSFAVSAATAAAAVVATRYSCEKNQDY